MRQPPGVASANQYAAFGWTDTRLATTQTQAQDDFGDVAQFSPLPSTKSNTLEVVAAIFGGLVVAGAVLLIFLRLRRRPKPPTQPPAEIREPVSVG